MSFKKYFLSLDLESKILDDREESPSSFQNNDFVIAVMDRGWVFVGFLTVLPNSEVRIDCAHVLHNWGTSKGLGEIAINGPTKNTVLYEATSITGKPIFLMKANLDEWP